MLPKGVAVPHDCPICGQPISDLPVTVYRERGMAVAGAKFVLLTGAETDVLTALARAFPRVVSKEGLMSAIYALRSGDDPEIKIIDVWVCKLRKKLLPLGIEIDTAWGKGYALRVARKPVIVEVAA